MSDLTIQASLNSGEWSPKLFARVDLAKYRSASALLENWFVDYRGGASTRPGTRYILQCYKSATPVRLIPFQASFEVGYVLEFGDQYIRFFFNGAPVLETAQVISGASQSNPCVLQIPGNTLVIGEWIFIENIVGMTQLNNKFFRVNNVAGANVTLGNISDASGVDSTGYGAYISGGTASRVYTIASPFAAADLALVKFAQNVNQLILCHPDYAPQVLTQITATSWTIAPITFGTTATPPTGLGYVTSVPGVDVGMAYVVTSVDANGQESLPSAVIDVASQDIRTVAGSIRISWAAAAGAVGYNIYKANVSYNGAVPLGSTFGYIGSATGLFFVDDNIAPDYSQTPPIARNPFAGAGVQSVTVTSAGVYTVVPTVTFTGAASTIAASAAAVLQVGAATVAAGGTGYNVGDTVLFTNGVILVVATLGGGGAVATWESVTFPGASPGQVTSGSVPGNPVVQISTSGAGTGVTANLSWEVGRVIILNEGAGYTSIPTVTFSSGAATAVAVLSPDSNGYPSVPGFFQQRLVLAAPRGAPQTFYMSQPGAYFNYNVSTISQADDAITGTLVSGQLNTIRAMVPQTSGLLMFTDRNNWLINGGSNGSAISPNALVANAQSFNGISDVPPIVANFDVLYVQAKGSIVRDSAFNIYANVFTGTDISALASHLFYGFTVNEWAWAEEPFKIAWGVRSDGAALSLTFLKEQEFVGWTHSITAGSFTSVATVVETTSTAGEIDAVYWVVERNINGNSLKYIERFAERAFPNGVEDAWCVDCGIGYIGAPETNFTGAEFLAGETVTGLADGVVIPPFVMPVNGNFTLSSPASKVTVGLPFTAKLQTMPLDMGDPTIQGKVKKINNVDVRVADTLGLKIGGEFDNITVMKDLVIGNVSSMLVGQNNQLITNLVNGDARTFLDPRFTVPGQYCIQQDLPLPATVLGLISDYTIGDGGRRSS